MIIFDIMKKVAIILLASVALLCSSCTAYRYTARQVDVEKHDIVASLTIVDVAVDYTKRISETSHRCKSVAEALQEAKYKAITNNDIDIIVDMIYKTEKRGGKYRVTITGFAGYYKNSRSLYEDIRRLGGIRKEDVEKYLILHNPEVLEYMYQKDDIVKIYHNENKPSEK